MSVLKAMFETHTKTPQQQQQKKQKQAENVWVKPNIESSPVFPREVTT